MSKIVVVETTLTMAEQGLYFEEWFWSLKVRTAENLWVCFILPVCIIRATHSSRLRVSFSRITDANYTSVCF